jgi:hypothetical protein
MSLRCFSHPTIFTTSVAYSSTPACSGRPAALADAALVVPHDEIAGLREPARHLSKDGDAVASFVAVLAALSAHEHHSWHARGRRFRLRNRGGDGEAGRRNKRVGVAWIVDFYFARHDRADVVANGAYPCSPKMTLASLFLLSTETSTVIGIQADRG